MISFIQSFLHTLEPETSHELVKKITPFLPKKLLKNYLAVSSSVLESHWGPLFIKNPIGLAAGFDKEGKLLPLIEALGFGFAEIGSVSLLPCSGQAKPRIHRLPKDEALINWMGLPNPGIDQVLKFLKQSQSTLPLGLNLVKTPDATLKSSPQKLSGLEDFVLNFEKAQNHADYLCLNLSCPNSEDARWFESPEVFIDLIQAIHLVQKMQKNRKPLLIKISPHLNLAELTRTIELALKYEVDGFIVTNTTTARPASLNTPLSELLKIKGGLSGKPLLKEANDQLLRVSQIIKAKKIIIGVGGVSDLSSLLQKFSLGARYVQVYTGLIYQGPTFVKNLLLGLDSFCKKQGVKNYQALIGEKI